MSGRTPRSSVNSYARSQRNKQILRDAKVPGKYSKFGSESLIAEAVGAPGREMDIKKQLDAAGVAAANELAMMKKQVLPAAEVDELAVMVADIYKVLPREAQDETIASAVLDAALVAQPSAGGRRGGGVLTRSRDAIRETAQAGVNLATGAGDVFDSTLAAIISKAPAIAGTAIVVNGGVTVIANIIRTEIVPYIPEPTSWATLVAEMKSAAGALAELTVDLSPLLKSPTGVMAIASIVMKYRAERAGTGVWALVKDDASKVAGVSQMLVAAAAAPVAAAAQGMAVGLAKGARGVGEAAQGAFYQGMSAYELEAQRKREATRGDFMSNLEHLKPTAENKARIEAAEGLVEMSGAPRGGRRRPGRKTKKSKKTKRMTRRRMPKFVY